MSVYAPWSPNEVAALNDYQQAGWFHPFTCGIRDEHPSDEGILVATENGWVCPVESCDYTQTWAHAFMMMGEEE